MYKRALLRYKRGLYYDIQEGSTMIYKRAPPAGNRFGIGPAVKQRRAVPEECPGGDRVEVGAWVKRLVTS